MVTKTFKIGLSATDKQNMAQDIYEQVEQLLFAEYDSSETYNTGDFVVYSNVLYRCKEDNVTGTWNSAKWEQATLQDLVDSVNGAVASITGKANTADLLDGVLVPSQALSAKAINPVSSESGTFQTTPFILQGTGTANGTDSVDTSNVGKHVEKHGNSVCVNNKVNHGNFDVITGWVTPEGATISNNVLSANVTGTSQYATGVYRADLSLTLGHKYLVSFKLVLNDLTKLNGLRVRYPFVQAISPTKASDTYYIIGEVGAGGESYTGIQLGSTDGTLTMQLSEFEGIDLTQWFNGDIPQDLLDHPENAGRYGLLDVAYNTGTLTNANGRYLECGGRNVWDEETESGYIGSSSGSDIDSNDYRRCVGFIKIIPNTTYYFKSNVSLNTKYYDINKNYIGAGVGIQNGTQTSPTNACYLRFYYTGITYNHDITISLYYSPEQGGEGYSDYYPYEEPKVYDTGSETLRSADSVKDVKLPSGEITRNVGSYTFTGSESWTETQQGRAYCTVIQSLAKHPSDGSIKANLQCNAYQCVAQNNATAESSYDKVCALNTSGAFIVKDSSIASGNFASAMAGKTIYFELATPTTEQGTPFSENIEINDYGTMGWKSNSTDFVAIPQGCKIFYPADYVLLIDTLNGYVSGSVENLALKTDIPTAIANYFASITGYDNTKTQTLKQVEGTLTWVDD